METISTADWIFLRIILLLSSFVFGFYVGKMRSRTQKDQPSDTAKIIPPYVLKVDMRLLDQVLEQNGLIAVSQRDLSRVKLDLLANKESN